MLRSGFFSQRWLDDHCMGYDLDFKSKHRTASSQHKPDSQSNKQTKVLDCQYNTDTSIWVSSGLGV